MERTYEVSGPAALDVRLAAGEIEVSAREGATLSVELVAEDAESQDQVERARVELQAHAGRPRLLVDVPQRRGGFSLGGLFGRQGVRCLITAPSGSSLRARTKSADVEATGSLGEVDVATASGDVAVERVDGSLSAKTASGDVSACEVRGETSVQTASGDVDVDVAHGKASVASASGDVRIGDARGDLSVNTVSGDQRHEAVVRGRVAAHSVSGDVEIGVRRGSRVHLDCSTVGGETRSELELTGEEPAGDGPFVEVRAKTVSGDIAISRAPAPSSEELVEQEVPA